MAYFLSPALAQLRAEVNALWPHRDKTSDGWIGDTSHAARPSDHNPDRSAGGIVRALDIDEDLVEGLTTADEAMPLVEAIIRDVRVRYVIYEGHIWSRDTGRWSTYTGANAHRHHIHVSVRTGRGYDLDASPWGIATTVSRPAGGTGGSITTPTIPGRPAPITPEDDMDAAQNAALADIYSKVPRILQILEAFDPQRPRLIEAADRVMGVLPDLRTPDGRVATVLTTAEGQILRDDVAASTARAVAETSSAFHQLVGVITGAPGATVDTAELATALKTTLGAAVADELASRLKGV